jgi:methionine synthase II (cobalamin-independent)
MNDSNVRRYATGRQPWRAQTPIDRQLVDLIQRSTDELVELVEAGCKVIQMEEPQIHLVAAKGLTDNVLNPDFMVEVFNNTVRGLRSKAEIWCHTCWGNPRRAARLHHAAKLRAGNRASQSR